MKILRKRPNTISCFERRDETNGRTDFSRAEQVSQRVPHNGSQKKKTARNTSLIPKGHSSLALSAI